jgi:hypothetical protein
VTGPSSHLTPEQFRLLLTRSREEAPPTGVSTAALETQVCGRTASLNRLSRCVSLSACVSQAQEITRLSPTVPCHSYVVLVTLFPNLASALQYHIAGREPKPLLCFLWAHTPRACGEQTAPPGGDADHERPKRSLAWCKLNVARWWKCVFSSRRSKASAASSAAAGSQTNRSLNRTLV